MTHVVCQHIQPLDTCNPHSISLSAYTTHLYIVVSHYTQPLHLFFSVICVAFAANISTQTRLEEKNNKTKLNKEKRHR